MNNAKCTITFMPSGTKAKVERRTKLLKAAWDQKIEVNAVCGGEGTCGKCQGKIVAGEISEPTDKEKGLLSEKEQNQGIVLLCQREIIEDVIVELDDISDEQNKYIPCKGNIITVMEADPIVTKTFHEPISLSQLFGMALDIGTTSVAGYLINLQTGEILKSASAANRQRAHGADVISRIHYTIERPDGLLKMKNLVIQTIDEVIKRLLADSGIAYEHVSVITIVGNTVMSHLLLGVSPVGIASASFIPAFTKSITGTAEFLGLKSLPETARFILLPNIAGYVGSDIVGVILAAKVFERFGNWLVIDIGTNGEIVLSTKNRLLTCSAAAGPAFEGACISQGMRAEPGAIYKVEIKDDVKIAVIGDLEPKGICGSGLVDAVSELIRIGVVKSNGRFKDPDDCSQELSLNVKHRIIKTEKGLKFVVNKGKNEVAITQKDISELQLGKGAIRAGIEILLEEAGVTELDGILLAGAFGSNSRLESLNGIDMLPDIKTGRIKAIGNAAGTGAIMALLSRKQLQKAFDLPNTIEHVELSLHKDFQRKFARALCFG